MPKFHEKCQTHGYAYTEWGLRRNPDGTQPAEGTDLWIFQSGEDYAVWWSPNSRSRCLSTEEHEWHFQGVYQ